MIEILKNFEQVAGGLSPLVLVVPGLLIAALGLFIWLGGLGFRRALLALVGATAGALCAFLVASQNAALIALTALVIALVAAIFQRLFTAVLLGALSFAIAFGIVAWPSLAEYRGTLIAGRE